MARAALKWSIDDLAAKAGLGRATVARFESGSIVDTKSIDAMKAAFEGEGVQFVALGVLTGAVSPN